MTTFRPIITRWATKAVSGGRDEWARLTQKEGKVRERELIEEAQRGDHRAFEELLQRHQRRVLSLISNLVRQPNEVEDIAQQVFLKVHLALRKFDFRSAFSTWLYRIVVNECYDHLRRQRSLKSPGGSEIAVGEWQELDRLSPSASSGSQDFARRVELGQIVERLFRRLSPEERTLLTLRDVEGFSVEEIARVLELKENTVKVRLFRVRKRLLEVYKRLSGQRR